MISVYLLLDLLFMRQLQVVLLFPMVDMHAIGAFYFLFIERTGHPK